MAPRDPDVSDEIWAKLQTDKRAAEEREQQHRELFMQEDKMQCQLSEKTVAELQARQRAQEEACSEARRLHEEERLKHERIVVSVDIIVPLTKFLARGSQK